VASVGHLATLADHSPTQRAGLMELIALGERLLQRAVQCQGMNIGINLGKAGGAGVPGHLHVHLVPRWAGDVNYMTTIAQVRVIPQALESSYAQLCEALAGLEG
jgi:ATP adenylyltransferase